MALRGVPYGWKMSAKAALKWIKVAEKNIEIRLNELNEQEDEYLNATVMWKILHNAENEIAQQMNRQ